MVVRVLGEFVRAERRGEREVPTTCRLFCGSTFKESTAAPQRDGSATLEWSGPGVDFG